MDEDDDRFCSGISRKCVIEEGEVSILEGHEELVAEGSAYVMTLVVLSMIFCVLSDELLLV